MRIIFYCLIFWSCQFRRWTSVQDLPLAVLRGELLLSCRIRSIETDGMLCVRHTPCVPPLRDSSSADGILFVQMAGLEHTKASIKEVQRHLKSNQRVTLQVWILNLVLH